MFFTKKEKVEAVLMKIMNIYFVIVILLTSLHSSTQLKQHTARARVEDVPAYCATILYKVSQSDEQALECYNVTSGMTGFRRCSQLGGYQYAFARALPLASPNDSSLVAYFTSLAKEALDDVARNRDWVVSHQPGIRHARPFSLPPDEPEMPKLHDVHPSAYGLCTPPEITTMIDRINRMNEIEQEKYKINLASSER